jgi:hypothetical protein
VVIHYFNVVCITIDPAEADPPLIVDANAVLPLTILVQRFQPISWRYPQVSGTELAKLA